MTGLAEREPYFVAFPRAPRGGIRPGAPPQEKRGRFDVAFDVGSAFGGEPKVDRGKKKRPKNPAAWMAWMPSLFQRW